MVESSRVLLGEPARSGSKGSLIPGARGTPTMENGRVEQFRRFEDLETDLSALQLTNIVP